MSATATHARSSIIYLDEHLLHLLLNSAQLPMTSGDVDVSVFGTLDAESIKGHRGAAFNVEGFRKGSLTAYIEMLNEAIGPTTSNHLITYMPEGEVVGNDAFLINSNENSFEVSAPFDGAVMISAVFAATGGPRLGKILHAALAVGLTDYAEVKTMTALNATINGVFTLPATSLGLGGTVTITPGDSAGTVQTAIRALAGYNDVGVTVTGSTGPLGGGPVAFRSVSSWTGTGSSAVVTKPAGTVENDIMIAVCAILDNPAGNITAPAGWNVLDSPTINGKVFWKKATGAEGANYTFNFTSSSTPEGTIAILCYSGADATPIDAYAVDNSQTMQITTPAPTVTSTVANTRVVAICMQSSGGAPMAGSGFGAAPTGFTERYVEEAGGATMQVADKAFVGPGATGVANFNTDGGGAAVATYQIVLEPSAGAADSDGTYTVTLGGALEGEDIGAFTTPSAGWSSTTSTEGGSRQAVTNVTATGTGSNVDGGAATADGATAHLHVVNVGGTTPSMVVTIEGSANGSSGWSTIVTFTAATDETSQRVVVAGAIPRYLRAKHTISGTNPTFAYSVALSRFGDIKFAS